MVVISAVALHAHIDDPFTLRVPDAAWTTWRATPPAAAPVV